MTWRVTRTAEQTVAAAVREIHAFGWDYRVDRLVERAARKRGVAVQFVRAEVETRAGVIRGEMEA